MEADGFLSPDDLARSSDVDRLDEARSVLPTGGPGPGVSVQRSGTPEPVTVGATAHREWLASAQRLDDGRQGARSYRLTSEQRERFEHFAAQEGMSLMQWLALHVEPRLAGER